ncbi:MAG: glycosyltransferase [Lachnospiraceae bacterium]|nr:glycosyltransferase [Lachnospiraceae bacterium]
MQGRDSFLKEKKVLFITTKNLDYIRNVQEIKKVKERAKEYVVIGSYNKYYFFRLLVVFVRILLTRTKDFDTVFIGFAPQLIVPFWGWKWKKSNVIIDFFISLYDTLCYDRKRVSAESTVGRLLYYLDKKTLMAADYVFCDTNAHGKYFIEQFQVPEKKVHTWYLEANDSLYYPMNVKKPKSIRNKFVVLYCGGVFPLQGVDVVLRVMNILKDETKLHFFFIGPIKDKNLKKIMPISENITYIKWLSQDKLAKYIGMADLCLAGHFNSSIEKATRTIPGKAYIYQKMGKKMILGENKANRELFEESDQVMFVQMGDEKALADKIADTLEKMETFHNEVNV